MVAISTALLGPCVKDSRSVMGSSSTGHSVLCVLRKSTHVRLFHRREGLFLFFWSSRLCPYFMQIHALIYDCTHTHVKPVPTLMGMGMGMGMERCRYGYLQVRWVWNPHHGLQLP